MQQARSTSWVDLLAFSLNLPDQITFGRNLGGPCHSKLGEKPLKIGTNSPKSVTLPDFNEESHAFHKKRKRPSPNFFPNFEQR